MHFKFQNEWMLVLTLVNALVFGRSALMADDLREASQDKKVVSNETAVSTVKAVINDLKDCRPVVLWECLPRRQQIDINEFVQQSANNSDLELHNRFFQAARGIVKVASTQKKFLFEMARKADGVTIHENTLKETGFDAAVELMDIIVNSEISNTETLESFNGETFLAGAVTRLLKSALRHSSDRRQEWLQFWSNIDVREVNAVGDSSLVRITFPVDLDETQQESWEIEFVKVDGKWIPKDLAESWSDIAQVLKLLSEHPAMADESQKQIILSRCEMIDRFIAEAESAKTQDEFEAAILRAVLPLYLAMVRHCTGMDVSDDFDGDSVEWITHAAEQSIAEGKLFESSQTSNQRTAEETAEKARNQRIAEQIAEQLRAARLEGFDISIGFKDGEARMFGVIKSAEQREIAERAVYKVPGVKSVTNELEVKE